MILYGNTSSSIETRLAGKAAYISYNRSCCWTRQISFVTATTFLYQRKDTNCKTTNCSRLWKSQAVSSSSFFPWKYTLAISTFGIWAIQKVIQLGKSKDRRKWWRDKHYIFNLPESIFCYLCNFRIITIHICFLRIEYQSCSCTGSRKCFNVYL